jgi:acyl-CoA thioesterase
MSQLRAETEVRAAANGFVATVSPAWNIAANPNGGYLLAIVMAAITEAPGRCDALSVTAHYLRPGTGGAEADVEVDVVRSGRTLSSVRAVLRQDGKERVLVMAAMGTLDDAADADGAFHLSPTHEVIPPPEACVDRADLAQGVELPILSRLDVRIHPDDAVANPNNPAQLRGWIRLRDGAPPDSQALLLFADAFPPSVFTRFGNVGWVPTIELTAHVRAKPAQGWVQAAFVVDDFSNGRLVESGTLWDSAGEMVARSRQLGLLRLA